MTQNLSSDQVISKDSCKLIFLHVRGQYFKFYPKEEITSESFRMIDAA